MSMLFKRIKDWARTITAFRTGDVIPVDGPDGTAKMRKDDLLRETAENTKDTFYDTPELPLGDYDGFYAIGSVGNDAKNFRLGDNLKLVYNMLKNYHKDLVVVENDEQTTSQYYIYVNIDIKAGETYLIKLTRSFGRNADTKLQSRDASRQAVEDIGYLKANETERYFVFSPTQNAKYICIFDTSNDGAKYATNVFVNKDVFVETGYNLFGYYPHTKSIVRGARFGNATFPTIQSSTNRLTVENLVEMPVNSYCTINLSDYQFAVVQSTKDDGTGQFADSGWKNTGALVRVLYKYQSFNIRKADNTNITAEELALAKNNIKFVINEVSEEKGVKLPDYYFYKDEMIKSAKSNFINRNTFTLANHATTNFAGASSNTAQATHFSANRGFKCVENDIRITSDGHFVLSHSNDMREGFVNNDGTEIADAVIIENSTLSDLKTNYKSKVGGYRICTLDEQLAICKSRNMCMVAEVKDFDVTQLDNVLEVVELCKNYLGYENFVLTSFSEQLLDLVRSKDVSVTLLYITYRNDKPDLDKLAYSFGNSAIYLDYYSVAKYDGIDRGYDEYIADAIEMGIPLAAWTLEMDDVAKVSKDGNYKLIATNYSATGDLCGIIALSYNGRKQSWAGYVSGQPQWHNGTVVGDTLVLAQNQSFSYSFSGVVNAKIVVRIVFEGTLNIDNNYHNVTELLGTEFESGCYEIVLSVGKTTNFTSLQIKNNDASDAVIRDLEIYLVEC